MNASTRRLAPRGPRPANSRPEEHGGRADNGPRGGWLKPAALAATVLLSFSLVMNIVIDVPPRYEQVGSDAGAVSREPAGRKEATGQARRAVDANPAAALLTAAAFAADAGRAGNRQDADDAPDESLAMLRAIADLAAVGEVAAARERLVEFLVRYPDHPVSVTIYGQGN